MWGRPLSEKGRKMSPTAKKLPVKPPEAAELRRRAETQLNQNHLADLPQTEVDMFRLLHELQVHQIELEIQNEELRQVRAEMEAALERYTDLYDFAPVGYFTLGRDGTVLQVNLCGARLLGIERSLVIKRRFGLFVRDEDRSIFNAFLENVFEGGGNKTCELILNRQKEDRSPSREYFAGQSVDKMEQTVVQIEATSSEGGRSCRAVILDITERKRNEEAMHRLMEQKVSRTEELEALTYISATMRQARTRATMIPLLVIQSVRAMKSQMGILALLEGEFLEFSSGTGKLETYNGMKLSQGKELLWDIVRSGAPRIFDNLFESKQGLEENSFLGRLTYGLGACVIAPLKKENTTIGLLILGYSRSIIFSVNQMRLVMAISDMAGSALHRMSATEALEKIVASRDKK
jgi:PAS domain S-box-containing protein